MDKKSGKGSCGGCHDRKSYERRKRNREYFFARYTFHIWMVLLVLQLWEGVYTTLDWIAVFVYPITWVAMMPNIRKLRKKYKK